MDTFQLITSVAFVVAAIVFIAYMAYREGAKGALKALTAVAGETTVLDRVEGTITTTFQPAQIEFFRSVIFPVFALGLSITPQGDLHEAAAAAQKLVDVLTDRLPNTPPGTTTTTTTETKVTTEATPPVDPLYTPSPSSPEGVNWQPSPPDEPKG